mmetsp:Transcript_24363/g.37258  ORF Transcript_24363/g.37258 Transcript_24363/m.37258 type:complete len:90 (+) Transcript_24363:533-802(+)
MRTGTDAESSSGKGTPNSLPSWGQSATLHLRVGSFNAAIWEVDGGGREASISFIAGSAEVLSIQSADGVWAQGAGSGTRLHHHHELYCL